MSKQKYPQTSVSTTSSTGAPRKGRDSYSSHHLHAKRNRKRQEAEDRQSTYDALTLKEKFATLIPGGSKRQLRRLDALMDAQPAPSAPPVVKIPKKAKK